MAYKKLIKVSNVCQLMDKSKYPATTTKAGVTFTNNGDGTITVNGTATERAIFNIQTPNYFPSNLIGHKCLLEPNTSLITVPDTINIHATNWDVSNIKPIGEITATPKIRISVFPGYTANNLVFKPQLFDLTEMYGAGHEPTTVEQFRQDFPDEMYDYSPYCFVKSYKKLIKVSNVCQLLDKSKYPATQTGSGVTFTSNGDGSITVNGTATNEIYRSIKSFGDSLYLSHKYLLTGENSGLYLFVENRDENNVILAKLIHNQIRSLPSKTKRSTYVCYIKNGVVCDNLVLKPQLFDLTEMYGAGNEPTTVEQFQQDFPDEMYDYKPYSIVNSYKRNLTCKTKNLLPYPYYETTITRNGVTFTDNRDGTITANGTSTSFATFVFSKNFNFIAGNTYYVSTPYSIIAYKENGTIYYIQGNKSFTWSSNWEVVQIYVQINKGITLNNLKIYPMINLGNTATDYVPYGYL